MPTFTRYQPWTESLLALLRRPPFVVGATLLSFYVATALVAPLLYPRTLTAIPVDTALLVHCSAPQGPTLQFFPLTLGDHPLGQTEYMGFGVAQGLIAGSRWDLFLISAITVPSMLVGTFLGLASGTYGGWVDRVVMTVTDAFLSVPYFVLVILVLILTLPRVSPTQGPYLFIGAMNGVMWAPFTRVVRGESTRIRQMTYVESAKASGASPGRILLHHILPNSASPALAQVPVTVALTLTFIIASQFITTAIITSGGTSCSTLGAGLSSITPVVPYFNYPEWGGILSAGLAFTGGWLPQPDHPFGVYWWGALIPGVWIAAFGLSILLISDGVRDWLSPKARK